MLNQILELLSRIDARILSARHRDRDLPAGEQPSATDAREIEALTYPFW